MKCKCKNVTAIDVSTTRPSCPECGGWVDMSVNKTNKQVNFKVKDYLERARKMCGFTVKDANNDERKLRITIEIAKMIQLEEKK